MEEEANNQLPFLDVQFTKPADGKIWKTVYRKTTNTWRILHFQSNHPVGHKRDCVRTLFRRVQTRCSDDSGKQEEMKDLHVLLKPKVIRSPSSASASKSLSFIGRAKESQNSGSPSPT
ncbi:unnamed protein product [Dibothriocephalus latus]|uniref:Helix-turn-helix domain-containing protein n=1 Tax=Dibothriocephalus latus TaxID=60516 RepID=A0A3P7LK38_DIBLA|nr:unnamed protein product [Dibothriocephalus latus]